jgi:polysaccharide pyruvyl transferase WcaK-like protein
MGKPAVLMGIGSGPLSTRRQRTLARASVRQADLLVLRDASSARILAASGAEPPFRVGADPAWSLFEFGAGRAVAQAARNGNGNGNGRPDGSPTVVAVLDGDACDEQLTDRLAQAFGSLRAQGIRLRLQPWRALEGRSDDVRLAGVVAGRIPNAVEIAEPPESLAGAGRAFAGAQLVVVLRQHALMAAAAAGLPAVAVARDAGLVDLARRLRQPAVTASAPPERIADVIRLSLGRPAASRSAVQGQVSSAEEGFRLLRLLVSGGRAEDANDLTGLPLEPAASA